MTRLGDVLRVRNWWFSKIPPLVAIVYLEILRLDIGGQKAISLLVAFLWSVMCVASYGHVINDIFDVHPDQLAGRSNSMRDIGWRKRILLAAALLGCGYLPALLADYSTLALLTLTLNYLWPTIYSVPPFRLKEKGVLGVMCDALGSHVTPTLFALTLFAPLSPAALLLYIVTVTLWAAALGIKAILHHQVVDLDDDRRSGTVTLATQFGEDRCRHFLTAFNLLVERPMSAALVGLVFGFCPLAAVAFIGYGTAEAIKYRRRMRSALAAGPGSVRPSIPFTNEFFYVRWLPMAAAAQLATHHLFWLWLPFVHAFLFYGWASGRGKYPLLLQGNPLARCSMETPAQSVEPRHAPFQSLEECSLTEAEIEEGLGRAIAFLRQAQLPHGEFKTLLGTDPQLSNAVFDSSPFVTSFVVYAFNHVERGRVADMLHGAVAFLRSEMEFGGLWRYYATRQYKHCRIPPDLDDAASVSYALQSNGQRIPANRWLFRYNRDKGGRFLTWVLAKKRLTFTPRFWFTRLIGTVQARLACRKAPLPAIASDPRLLATRTDPVPADEVDPVVNANVILYLGEDNDTAAAVRYLVDFIRGGPGDTFSLYYKDILSLYYMVARAHLHSAPTLAAVQETVVADILARQEPEGSFGNPLSTALAASALLTFAPLTPSLPTAIGSLLRSQRADGSWEKRSLYSGPKEFWGSEELTTALCIEVLARYQRLTTTPPSPPVLNLVSPQTRQNPYPVYAELRHNWPVYYDAARNIWVISRYADLVHVLRQPEVFSSLVPSFNPTMHGADAADHVRVRRMVGRLFSPHRVSRLADLVRPLAHDLVERIAARGECELIGDLAGPIPRTVVACMLGVDLGRLDDIKRWSAAIMGAGNDSVSDRERRAYYDEACKCRAFLMHHLDQLSRKPRGEHLAPFLTGIDDDDGLSVDEQVGVAMFLMAAGAETTTLLIGNAMLVLLDDPSYSQRLRADAQLIPAFIEEVLRYDSPAQRTKRITKHPAEIAGIRIPQGAQVELLLGSANRDPDKFADADQFCIDRQPNDHISFGQGPHVCPGAQLARLTAAIVLETLITRLPHVHRAHPQEPVEFSTAISARGPQRLDLVFPRA